MYRDDAEALFARATVLEQELELARRHLAERDRELAAWRSGRPMPPARVRVDDVLEQLRRDEEREAQRDSVGERRVVKVPSRTRSRRVPPVPADRSQSAAPPLARAKVLERAREALGALDDEPLLMVGAVIETLGDEHDGIRFATLERIVELVRWINEIRG
jgi:hypothetical protein